MEKQLQAFLIHDILKKAGFNVGIAGNMGRSFSESVANNLYDYYVLELSSFQLDDIVNFNPNISVILNISKDHLDRYDYSLANYISSKFRIAKNQNSDNKLIINGKCKNSMNFFKKV